MTSVTPYAHASSPPTGRRIRLPVPLLFSPNHSPLAVALYALLDVLGGPGRGAVEASRAWLAARLGVSEGGIKKALAALSREHPDETAPSPAYLVSTVRGCKLTARRQTLPGVPYVELPEWTVGYDEPIVPARSWRLYAAYMWLRHPEHRSVAHPRREVAQLMRVRADSIPGMVREIEQAGLVVTAARPGRETVIMPLTIELSDEERATVAELLAATCGQQTAVDEPHPSAGPSPHPHTGPAPHPSTGRP